MARKHYWKVKQLNRNTVLSTAFIAALSVSALANASDKYDLKVKMSGDQVNIFAKGVKTIGGSGSITSSSGTTTTQITVSVSQIVSPNIELLGGINYFSISGSNSTGFLAGARYYFDPSQDKQVLPFVGAAFIATTGSGFNSTGFAVSGGLQYFLQPNISVTPALQYTSTTGSGNTTNTFGLIFGLTYWFK